VATMILKEEGPERQQERHPFDLEERTAVFGERTAFDLRQHLPEMNFQDPTPSFPQIRTRARNGARVAQALSLFEAWNFYGAWSLEFGAL
jgi:hypothetical protein